MYLDPDLLDEDDLDLAVPILDREFDEIDPDIPVDAHPRSVAFTMETLY